MAKLANLDVDSVAAVGLLFLNGDCLEDILRDKYEEYINYNYDSFNECKKIILKIERINPELPLVAVLWQMNPDNSLVSIPVVAGSSLPLEGWGRVKTSESLLRAFNGESGVAGTRDNGKVSHYYPVKNSDGEIVGALELIEGLKTRVDI